MAWGGLLWVVAACGGRTVGTELLEEARGDGGPAAVEPTATGARSSRDLTGRALDDPADGPAPTAGACGNGVIESGEQCDGRQLGGESCATITMNARPVGTLACTVRCTFELSRCEGQTPPPMGAAGSGSVGGTMGGGGFVGSGMAGTGGTTSTGGTAGSSWGDPHLFTADGVRYDFQAVGEFVMLEDADDPSFVVQVRQSPYRDLSNLSVNSAVAARVVGVRVAIYAGAPARVLAQGEAVSGPGTVPLAGGGVVEIDEEAITVIWPSGESLLVGTAGGQLLNLSYTPSERRTRRIRGLLGTPDGRRENDLTSRGGEILALPPTVDAIYDRFGESWRIAAEESLFDYAPGESPAGFQDRAFPYGSREPHRVGWTDLHAGQQVCLDAGVAREDALAACAMDVAVTGYTSFAVAAAATERVASARGAPVTE